MKFIASSGNISIDNADLGAFIESLMDKKDAKLLELNKALEVIERINDDYRIITGFEWTKQKVDDLFKEKTIASEKIAENKESWKTCQTELENSNIQKKKLEELKNLLNEQYKLAQDRIKGFDAYIEKNSRYLVNVQKHNEIQGRINNYTNQIKKHEADRSKLEELVNELRGTLLNKNNAKATIEEKLLSVSDAAESETIAGSVQELEGRLEVFKKQQSSEVTVLNKQIGSLRKDIRVLKRISKNKALV